MMQPIRFTRRGGYVSFIGVPHEVDLNGEELFFSHVRLHGGPVPVRRYVPALLDLVWSGKIDPGKVFDRTLPLDLVAEGYHAMDERRAIKALLRPQERSRVIALPFATCRRLTRRRGRRSPSEPTAYGHGVSRP